MADESKLLDLEIISPERVFYEGKADMVEMKTSEGEIGVYKGHIPLTSIIVPGILKIHENGNVKEAALHDGFVEIFSDRIVILAESCEWPEEIDLKRAEAARDRAENRLRSGDRNIDVKRAEYALRKALTRIDLASRS